MENYLFEGNISVKAAVMGGMREVSEIIVDEAKKDRDTQWILHRAAERGIPIVTASRAHIDSLARDIPTAACWPDAGQGAFSS